jgi:hypothetical protein
LRDAAARWATLSAPLTAARAAILVHAAAAALAAGMISAMYLRGLVFDYRVAWQSTFLESPTVQAMLGLLLAPASAITGLGLPDVATIEAMRLTPDSPRPTAPAASWIHLYAATLVLVVVAPRIALATVAFLRASVQALRMDLPVDVGAVGRFARWHRAGLAPLVHVLPYAQAPGAQAALGLRELLAAEIGEDLVLKMADVTGIGDEQATSARIGSTSAALRVGLADLGATPEAEHHGRFMRAVMEAKPPAQAILLVDESAFRTRFAGLPGRLDERRDAWRRFAQEQDLRLAIVNLDQPDQPFSVTALQQALQP